jgi:hypothetical protein
MINGPRRYDRKDPWPSVPFDGDEELFKMDPIEVAFYAAVWGFCIAIIFWY